jgi:L-amino acid N-acyltransferase YncA
VTATVRPMRADDGPAVLRIYEEGIATRNATFEAQAPSWREWDAAHLAEHRLVAETAGEVAGWIAATAVSDRCCYAGVVEHSVYVDPAHQRQGIARLLLDAFVASTEAAGIWTIQSGVFPENVASLAAHERAGFRVIGVRHRIGQLDGVWRDVVSLERRSTVAGA